MFTQTNNPFGELSSNYSSLSSPSISSTKIPYTWKLAILFSILIGGIVILLVLNERNNKLQNELGDKNKPLVNPKAQGKKNSIFD